MEEMEIIERIFLEPEFLTDDIKNNIFNKIKKKFEGYCNYEYGYFVKIIEIINILDNWVSNVTHNVIFKVKFKAVILRPEKEKILECNVKMIFQHGIFMEINKLKLLIPIGCLKNYEYDKNSGTFISKKKTIKITDVVKVKIKDVRYENKNFSCIGEIVENI